MHFPLFPTNFSDSEEIVPILPLPKNVWFSSAKFSDDLFSHWVKILNYFEFSPPYFRYFNTFPPYFAKIIISPYISKFPHVFVKFTCFFTYFVFFVSLSFPMMHLCIAQCTYWTFLSVHGRQSWGWRAATPQILGCVSWGFQEILLYSTMYRNLRWEHFP